LSRIFRGHKQRDNIVIAVWHVRYRVVDVVRKTEVEGWVRIRYQSNFPPM